MVEAGAAARRRVLASPELAFQLGRAGGLAVARALSVVSKGVDGEGTRAALPALLRSRPPEVYVFGGECWRPGEPRVILADVERYDPCEDTWEALPKMPSPRVECAATACAGLIYVLGGESDTDGVLDTVDCFNPLSGTWSTVAPMISARSAGAAASSRGCIFALGGRGEGTSELLSSRPGGHQSTPYRTLDSVERLDTSTGVWEPLPRMPAPREHFAAGVREGRLFALGGCNDNTFWAMLLSGTAMPGLGCDALNLATGCWERVSLTGDASVSLGIPRSPWCGSNLSTAAGGRCGGRMYIVGGHMEKLRRVDVAEEVELDQGCRVGLPAPPVSRSKCAAAFADGGVYVLGGHDGPRYWASGERLDLDSGNWVPLPPMSRARAGCAAASIRR